MTGEVAPPSTSRHMEASVDVLQGGLLRRSCSTSPGTWGVVVVVVMVVAVVVVVVVVV